MLEPEIKIIQSNSKTAFIKVFFPLFKLILPLILKPGGAPKRFLKFFFFFLPSSPFSNYYLASHEDFEIMLICAPALVDQ